MGAALMSKGTVDWVALEIQRRERHRDEAVRRTMGLRPCGILYSYKGSEWGVPYQLFVSSADHQEYIREGTGVYTKRTIWEARR